MKNVRMAGVAFFLLMMQLVCLSVKADNKADYLKLAQKVRQEVWDNTPVDFKKRAVPEKFKKKSAVILSYYKGELYGVVLQCVHAAGQHIPHLRNRAPPIIMVASHYHLFAW